MPDDLIELSGHTEPRWLTTNEAAALHCARGCVMAIAAERNDSHSYQWAIDGIESALTLYPRPPATEAAGRDGE